MKSTFLIACHECDLLHRVQPIPEGKTAKCIRCGAVLHSHKRDSIDRTLSLTIAGMILFVLSNAYPLLALKSEGLFQEITLMAGVIDLFDQNMWGLAMLVFLTCILFPLFELSCMLYILLPIKLNKMPWKVPLILRTVQSIKPWGMMEVFMLGILVSIVKLIKMADIIPGIALYSFTALIFVLAGAAASFDFHAIWDRLGDN